MSAGESRSSTGCLAGIWAMVRFGARDTLLVGLGWFAVGNLLCGAATDVTTLAAAKLVEGIGKGAVIVLCRSLLYRQFDRAVIVAIGFYGVIAYATRPTTPLLTALINDALSWRWIFWVNVPLALLAFPLVRRFIKPDRPAQPLPLRIDWVSVTLFVAWIVSVTFTFGWYRKWGGWTSNAFTATALLAMVLPFALVAWVGAGLAVSEHFNRMFRVRGYVLAMCVRMLLLVQLLAVLTLMANYCVELRDYPREMAGWILAPATLTMAVSTFLTTWFHRRELRHFWLLVGVVGCAACLWWMSSVDNFTSKGQVAWMIGCWGLFVGLFPPAFLQDEVEGLDRRDFLVCGGARDRRPGRSDRDHSDHDQHDRFRLERSGLGIAAAESAPEPAGSRGSPPPGSPTTTASTASASSDLSQMTSTVLGGFAKVEAAAHGIQSGLRFLSLIVGGIGLLVTALLAQSAAQNPLDCLSENRLGEGDRPCRFSDWLQVGGADESCQAQSGVNDALQAAGSVLNLCCRGGA